MRFSKYNGIFEENPAARGQNGKYAGQILGAAFAGLCFYNYLCSDYI
ncbi:MAG: hypothetical protein LUF83_04420 [Alistipes sp.]|nr:hypothetical protein [Alistipes sp.]